MFAYRRKKRSTIFATLAKPRRKRVMITWRAWLWGLAVILILAGFLYLAVWSPVFKIKKWSVEGVDFTDAAQAQELTNQFFQSKIWKSVSKDNWLIFSSEELSNRILSSFLEAASVAVEKNFLKGVKITIKGRQAAMLWCKSLVNALLESQATTTEATIVLPQSEECFFADKDGLIFREAPEISGIAWPTFFSQPSQNFDLGDQVAASSSIQFASQLKKQLRDVNVDSLGFMADAGSSPDLIVFTGENWLIYFNLNRSIQSQVKILGALLDNDLKNKRAELKYVDLRMANKVYYK